MRALANTVGSPVVVHTGYPHGTLLMYPMRLIDLGIIEREILRSKSEEFTYPPVDRETDYKLQVEVARQTLLPINKVLKEARTTHLPLSIWLSTNNRPDAGSQSITYAEAKSLCGRLGKKYFESLFMEVNGADLIGALESSIGPTPIQYTAFLSENSAEDTTSPKDAACHTWSDWRTVAHQISQALNCLPTDIAMMSLPQVMFTMRMYRDKVSKTDRKEFIEWQKKRGLRTETPKETSDSVLKELSMKWDDLL